ncbi:MAG: Bug family tripartite tricarboxylate transporter substrate binding protein, partial [Burkholderiales bacterium]
MIFVHGELAMMNAPMNASRMGIIRAIACVPLGAALLPSPIQAQTWPSKPVRWIVPFSPGGGVDVTTRTIAQRLSGALGQQLIVDNRGGANGNIGIELATKAPPDGHTLVMATTGNITINPHIYSKLAFDPLRDLTPVTPAVDVINVLVVHPSLPVKSVKELIAYAKTNPNKLSYGSSGAGSLQHVGMELLNQTAGGVKMLHVPYKGAAQIVMAMLANEVQVGMNSLFSVRPQVQAGRLRWLAMTADKRSPVVDLPTVAEAALPGFEMVQWYGIATPAKVRKPVVTA